MSEQQFIPEGMQQEIDRRIQAARGNLAAVRQELEQQLKSLGAQQATQSTQSAEGKGTLGEIALLRGELLYLDSLAERAKNPKPGFGSQRHSGSANQSSVGLGEKWQAIQPTKTHLVWISLAAVLLTLLVGFTWGGWTTTATAQKMATTAAKTAVIERLAPICVAQFNLDPDKGAKLAEFTALSSYQRAEYVRNQGWATMPGEEGPDRQVVDGCVTLLMRIGL